MVVRWRLDVLPLYDVPQVRPESSTMANGTIIAHRTNHRKPRTGRDDRGYYNTRRLRMRGNGITPTERRAENIANPTHSLGCHFFDIVVSDRMI